MGSGFLKRRGDVCYRRVAIELVVTICEIEVDRKTRHIPHEEIDCRAALERKGLVVKNHRRDADKELRGIEILRNQDLSTKSPSGERRTHR